MKWTSSCILLLASVCAVTAVSEKSCKDVHQVTQSKISQQDAGQLESSLSFCLQMCLSYAEIESNYLGSYSIMQDAQTALAQKQQIPVPNTHISQTPIPSRLRSDDLYLVCLVKNRNVAANKIKPNTIKAELKIVRQKEAKLDQLANTPNAKAFVAYMTSYNYPLDHQIELMQKYLAQPPQEQLTAQEFKHLQTMSEIIGLFQDDSEEAISYENLLKRVPK